MNRMIIIGDLHYEQSQHDDFTSAIKQYETLEPNCYVSLGDLGGYSHPGTLQSFHEARSLFSTLSAPVYPLIGNHDLEGKEFLTDQENIDAWLKVFERDKPFYSIEFNNSLFIFLSTTRFRKNKYCCHEVFIDKDQIEWFEDTVNKNMDKHIFVFSHAPILGSGIRVLQSLHLRSGNAWINQTNEPGQFIKLIRKYPNIKFWASGHNHLSQEYPDTVSLQNSCVFCHTGVISNITRDGLRQSRLIDFNDEMIQIYTIDHITGAISLKCTFNIKTNTLTRDSRVYLKGNNSHVSAPRLEKTKNMFVTGNSGFCVYESCIIEFDMEANGPVGVLTTHIPPHARFELTENKTLEIYADDILIEQFSKNELGTYSLPSGIRIEEHMLFTIMEELKTKTSNQKG